MSPEAFAAQLGDRPLDSYVVALLIAAAVAGARARGVGLDFAAELERDGYSTGEIAAWRWGWERAALPRVGR